MFQPDVDQVTALAPRREVSIGVVGGVVIAVRCGQNDPRSPHGPEQIVVFDHDADDPARTTAPRSGLSVRPAAIVEGVDGV